MKLDNETICEFGKAVFYASLLPELKIIAYACYRDWETDRKSVV